MNRFDKTLM